MCRRTFSTSVDYQKNVPSPTPAFEALKYVLAIIGFEARDVVSFDLPAQFLQTDMHEVLYLKITGALALLLVEYDRDPWGKHLQKEWGKPVIYVLCKKAICSTLNAAILAFRKLTGHLADRGFEMNPYDPCMWNSVMNGTQLSVVFHVYNGLISHIDPTVVTDTLRRLSDVYGKTDPLTIWRGNNMSIWEWLLIFNQMEMP